jgi:hypothetical protein
MGLLAATLLCGVTALAADAAQTTVAQSDKVAGWRAT